MGWLFSDQSKSDMIKEVTQGWENTETGAKTTCLAKAIRGKSLWTVFQKITPAANGSFDAERFIVLFLMEKQDGMWGYKDVSEDMGPCEVDCPLSYLDKVTAPTNEYSRLWRIKVRTHHRLNRIPKLRAGNLVRLREGLTPRDHQLKIKYVRSQSWLTVQGITLTPSVLRGCRVVDGKENVS